MSEHNLEDPLLDRNTSGGGGSSHSITKEELSSFFEPDNIREGTSVKKIQEMGGIESLLKALKVNPKNGLNASDENDLNRRRNDFGKNDPIEKPPISILKLIVEQFSDKMLQILSLAAVVSVIVGVINDGWGTGWIEGLAILIAVTLIVTVTAVNNYIRDKQFRNLNSKREQRDVPVVRSGKIVDVSVFDLLVGDIMHINTGENFPIDGILLKGNDLLIDESSITGESDAIRKHTFDKHGEKHDDEGGKIDPFLVSGAQVTEGTGTMVVCAVGTNSQMGKSKLKLQEEPEITPLQLKLEDVVDQISKVGKWAAILTFAGMLIHDVIAKIVAHDTIFDMTFLKEFLNYFLVAVTIIVVAIPEGLPLAVTISLAYSVGKMKKENNLVRFLSACETMGGANNICTDKTGTLTQNRMSVKAVYAADETLYPVEPEKIDKETAKLFSEAVCVNSDARPKKEADGTFTQIGNKTECALLELADKLGFEYEKFRENDNVKRSIPFSSKRKMMTTIWQTDSGKAHVYTKGASEMVLEKVTKIVGPNGDVRDVDDELIKHIKESVITEFASKALRTIAVAYKEIDLSSNIDNAKEEDLESDLTLIAITGIMDPLRKEIPEAIKTCKKAGITVRMVTGDNTDTATAISKECGILPEDYEKNSESNAVLEGKVFRQKVGGLIETQDENGNKVMQVKDLEAFGQIEKELRVLARSSPEDKYLLVTGLKQLRNVVAVTGDGTNDAPALKKADIGFAMGIMGTEVAKEASGIIILDDNFRSIVTAVKYGRNVFECVRKFIQFQLTVNVVAMLMVFLGGVILRESPFTPIQMLWVNLIMDTFASLALATEPPTDELLDRKPYGRTERIITPVMWRNIMGQAIYQIGWLVFLLFGGQLIFPEFGAWDLSGDTPEKLHRNTFIFNAFVFLQIFNFLNARKLKTNEYNVLSHFFNNPMFICIEILIIGLQIVFVQFGGTAMSTTPLSWQEYLICAGIGAGGLIIGLLIKAIPSSFFNNIKWFREEELSKDQLDFTTQGSLRRRTTLKYRSQGSLRPMVRSGTKNMV